VAKVAPKPSPVRCARLAAVFDLSRWSGLIEGEVRPRARTVASNRWAQVASKIQRPTRVPHRRPRHRRPPLPDRIRQPARPGQDYSPECVEGVFCELRPRRILGRLQAPPPCYFVIKCWPPCNLRVSSRRQARVLVQVEPVHGGARRSPERDRRFANAATATPWGLPAWGAPSGVRWRIRWRERG
jgi:hypothetical protein